MYRLLLPLTEPIGLGWFLLVLAAAYLLWKRRLRAAAGFGLIVLVLFLIGSTSLPARWLASLERPYANPDFDKLPEHDAVVMLGGILEPSAQDVFAFNLSGAADRLITAVELMRRHKAGALVLGGGGFPMDRGPTEEGRLAENWLHKWNLVDAPIYRLGACADTRDEASRTAMLVREKHWKRIILVTSASHMRRAEAVFRKQGMQPTCVACDFDGMAELELKEAPKLVPKAKGFRLFGVLSHEWVGWWYYRLRGWL